MRTFMAAVAVLTGATSFACSPGANDRSGSVSSPSTTLTWEHPSTQPPSTPIDDRSSPGASTPDPIVAASPFTIDGVMVEVDGQSLRIAATEAEPASCLTSFVDLGVEVTETDAEVRLAVRGFAAPITTTPGVAYGCTGMPQTSVLVARLAAPLDGRTVVDVNAGDVVRPVLRSEVLVPASLPDGWVGTDERFASTATVSRWWRRFQPDPLPVMVYGLQVEITWGADCAAEFDALIAGAPSLTPVVVRGVNALQTDELHGPRLFWEESGACMQAWGLGSCRSSAGDCYAIDRAQLAALVETMAPGP